MPAAISGPWAELHTMLYKFYPEYNARQICQNPAHPPGTVRPEWEKARHVDHTLGLFNPFPYTHKANGTCQQQS